MSSLSLRIRSLTNTQITSCMYNITLSLQKKTSKVVKFHVVYKEALEESFAMVFNFSNQITLVCNIFKLALPLQAVAAWHAWRFGRDIYKMWHAGGLDISDDIKLLAISEAVI